MYTFADVVDLKWVENRYFFKYDAIKNGKEHFPKGLVIGKVDLSTNEIENLGLWLQYECDECGAKYETLNPNYKYCTSQKCMHKNVRLIECSLL